MDKYSNNLQEFLFSNYELYLNVVELLDADNNWRRVVSAFKTYRIPVVFNERDIKKMETSASPSRYLLTELQNRFCCVGIFCEILRKCGLLDILALIADPEPIEIVLQPGEQDESTVCVPYGGELRLECNATGLPPPTYLWHHFNTPLPDQTEPVLSISEFTDDHIGEYYCIVSHSINGKICTKLSHTVIADIMPEAPIIIDDLPPTMTVPQDECVVFTINAVGRPPPVFQWVIDRNCILDNETSNTLKIKNVQPSDENDYRCVVSNYVGEVMSAVCKLTVYSPPQDEINIASAKLALLVGNEKYDNLMNLHTPSNDVVTIAPILMQLGFHVVALHNLTLIEMRNAFIWFCQLIPQNAYVFIYYVGHGFELGNKFLMPVDCPGPDSYLRAHCFCDQELIQYAMKASPQLVVLLLDMCLKMPSAENRVIHDERTPVFEYEHGNCKLILGTATAPHLSAHERQGSYNGLYMTYLSMHLYKDETITSILQKTQEDFQENDETKLQKPAIYMDSARKFKLTDPVEKNEEFNNEMSALTDFTTIKVLEFQRVGFTTTISVQPHREYFLNSVDILFSSDIAKWKPDVSETDLYTEEHNENVWTKDENHWILTLFDIQKAKSHIYKSIRLHNESESGNLEIVDYCSIEIENPLIEKALWFERPLTNDE